MFTRLLFLFLLSHCLLPAQDNNAHFKQLESQREVLEEMKLDKLLQEC